MGDNETSSKAAVCTFKRMKKGPQGRRTQTKASSSSGSSDDHSDQEVYKKPQKARSGLVQSTSGTSKKRKWKKQFGGQSSSSNSDGEGDDDEDVPKKKDFGVAFRGTGTEKSGPSDMGATATLEIDTAHDQDGRALFEKAQKVNQDRKISDEKTGKESVDFEDKVYRGANNYAKFIERKDSALGSAAKMSTGPQRAPAHIRTTVRWDYAPDICKDFKETGFCGFGDSCKFMHDRSDYKFGWQLEREMADGTYGKDDSDDDKYKISSGDDDDLPFKCFLCRESFVNPVSTKCKHYFCEKCALQHYKKSQRCYTCGAQTNGVFNPAKEIIAKMDKMKKTNKNIEEDDDSD